MHEMSIATSILDIAENSMNGHKKLLSITVQIGELSGVEIEALEFCFQAVKHSSRYPDLQLEIDFVEGEGHCLDCGKNVAMHEMFVVCPSCGNYTVQPTRGKELKVTSIEVE